MKQIVSLTIQKAKKNTSQAISYTSTIHHRSNVPPIREIRIRPCRVYARLTHEIVKTNTVSKMSAYQARGDIQSTSKTNKNTSKKIHQNQTISPRDTILYTNDQNCEINFKEDVSRADVEKTVF